MSFSGTGTFNINSAGQPVVAGTTITATAFNALTADLATGLSTCITKDGQQTVTANIPFANYRLTGVGAGTSGTDAANVAQVQGSASALVTVTGTDTLTGSMTPALTTYATGNQFAFVAANTNTTAVTLNIDGLGAKAVTRDGSTALVAGDIISGKAQLVVYDGTRFQLLNSPSFTNLKATALTVSPTSTNGLAITSAGSVTSPLVITGVAAQTGANISTSTPSATTNYWRLGQDGVVNWDIQNVATTGVFQITNGSQTPLTFNGSGFLNIANAGNVTIAAPSSGTTLTVTGLNTARTLSNACASAVSSFDAGFGVGLAGGYWNLFTNGADPLAIGTGGASQFALYTNGAPRISIASAGNVTIAAPSSGRTLTTTGTAAGTASLRLNTTATNAGTQTATWTAPTNKPGAAAGVVSQWIPIDLDGTTYYIPAWT